MAARLTLAIESDPEADGAALVGVSVRAVARHLGLTEDASAEAELCAVEAVNNAIEHAYDGRGEGRVEVALASEGQALRISVSDTGRSLDPAILAAAGPESLAFDLDDLTTLKEGGRGLAIIKTAMRDVGYASLGGRNTFSFRTALPGERD